MDATAWTVVGAAIAILVAIGTSFRSLRADMHDRRPRPKQWTDAVAVLRRLQGEYESWRDGLPEGLADSKTAQLLEGVCEVDLDALDVELPRGFGRD